MESRATFPITQMSIKSLKGLLLYQATTWSYLRCHSLSGQKFHLNGDEYRRDGALPEYP